MKGDLKSLVTVPAIPFVCLLIFFVGCQKENVPNPVDPLPGGPGSKIAKVKLTRIWDDGKTYYNTTFTIDSNSNDEQFIVHAIDSNFITSSGCITVKASTIRYIYEDNMLVKVSHTGKTWGECIPGRSDPRDVQPWENFDIDIRHSIDQTYPNALTYTFFMDTLKRVIGRKKVIATIEPGTSVLPKGEVHYYPAGTNDVFRVLTNSKDTIVSWDENNANFNFWLQWNNRSRDFETFPTSLHFFISNSTKQITSYVGINMWDSFYARPINGVGGEALPNLERKIDIQYDKEFDQVMRFMSFLNRSDMVPYLRIFDRDIDLPNQVDMFTIDNLLHQGYNITDSFLNVKHGKRQVINVVKYTSTATKDEKGRLKKVIKRNTKNKAHNIYEVYYVE